MSISDISDSDEDMKVTVNTSINARKTPKEAPAPAFKPGFKADQQDQQMAD